MKKRGIFKAFRRTCLDDGFGYLPRITFAIAALRFSVSNPIPYYRLAKLENPERSSSPLSIIDRLSANY